jgi:hypothetical protein
MEGVRVFEVGVVSKLLYPSMIAFQEWSCADEGHPIQHVHLRQSVLDLEAFPGATFWPLPSPSSVSRPKTF